MKQGSTLFLKLSVLLIGAVVLALCILIFVTEATNANKVDVFDPVLIGLYAPAIPFYIALYHAMKLLNLIDKNKAFSRGSIKSLKIIKYCAFIISGMFAAGMPYIYMAAEQEDAPGVIVIGFAIGFASFVISVFAGVLQKLFQNAMDIKSENDLTV